MVKKERDERRQRRGTTHDSRLWFQVWTGKRRQRPLPAKSQGGQAEAEAEVVCLSCQFPLQPTAIGLFFFFFFFLFFFGLPRFPSLLNFAILKGDPTDLLELHALHSL